MPPSKPQQQNISCILLLQTSYFKSICSQQQYKLTQPMFKRLFLHSQVQKLFSDSKIDKSHQMIFTKRITDLAARYFTTPSPSQNNNLNININIHHNNNNQINININNHTEKNKKEKEMQENRDEMVRVILKKLQGSSDVQRIKTLVVVHSIIRKTYSVDFMEIMGDELDKYIVSSSDHYQKQEKIKDHLPQKLQNSQKEFIQKNIISFYCQYLKKLIISIQTFRYAQKYLSTMVRTDYNVIELINHGFVILNLCNYILQSQYTFNKMGRYYLEYNEIINLFIMYLNDLIVYNSYIKELSKLAVKKFKESNSQEIRHHFLFVTESQKTSDRLYEFFYNRYYFSQVKKIILMPTFLTIHSDEFNSLATYVKKNDPQLAQLVKNSKFDTSGRARSKSKTFVTDKQESNSTKLNKTDFLFNNQSDFFSIMNMIKENTSGKDLQDLEDIKIKKIIFPHRE